jgi:outer membrane cobalamin receptor
MKWLALLLFILYTHLAFAQDSVEVGRADEDTIDLGVVVVEADPILEAERDTQPEPEPSPVTSIADDLADSSAVTIIDGAELRDSVSASDALERISGADIRRSGGAGQLDTVLLRGARAQQTLVLLDGAPLMPGQVADLSLLPAGNIERIEIVGGPEAARFGMGALGGVLNVVTGRERVDGTDATLRAGGNGFYELDLAGTSEAWDWNLSQMTAQNDYHFERQSGGSAKRENNDAQRRQLWLHTRTDDNDVRLGLSRLERGIPGSDEFPTLDARLSRENMWLQVDGADTRGAFSLQHTHFTDPHPYLQQAGIDTSDTRLHAELATGALALKRAHFGIRPRLDWISSSDYGTHLRGGADVGWFGESGCECSRLRRYYEIGATVSSDAGADPLARYAISYTFHGCTAAYASAGYAVRHPDFEELYLANQGSVQGNPDLLPERVLNYELGLRSHGEDWKLNAAAFYSDYRDSIIFAPVSAYLVRAINTGEATVSGIEADFTIDLNDSLAWSTSATWLPTAELASGLPLPGRAEQHISSTLALHHLDWRGSLTADYTGEMTGDLFGSLRIAPRTTFNFDAWRELDDTSELGVQVSNALDAQTRDAWHYPLPGREIFVTWRTNL